MKASYFLHIGISQAGKFLFPWNPLCVGRSEGPVAARTEPDWPGEMEAGCPSLVLRPLCLSETAQSSLMLVQCYLLRESRNSRTTQHNNHSGQLSSTGGVSSLYQRHPRLLHYFTLSPKPAARSPLARDSTCVPEQYFQ